MVAPPPLPVSPTINDVHLMSLSLCILSCCTFPSMLVVLTLNVIRALWVHTIICELILSAMTLIEFVKVARMRFTYVCCNVLNTNDQLLSGDVYSFHTHRRLLDYEDFDCEITFLNSRKTPYGPFAGAFIHKGPFWDAWHRSSSVISFVIHETPLGNIRFSQNIPRL